MEIHYWLTSDWTHMVHLLIYPSPQNGWVWVLSHTRLYPVDEVLVYQYTYINHNVFQKLYLLLCQLLGRVVNCKSGICPHSVVITLISSVHLCAVVRWCARSIHWSSSSRARCTRDVRVLFAHCQLLWRRHPHRGEKELETRAKKMLKAMT